MTIVDLYHFNFSAFVFCLAHETYDSVKVHKSSLHLLNIFTWIENVR